MASKVTKLVLTKGRFFCWHKWSQKKASIYDTSKKCMKCGREILFLRKVV